MIERADLLPWAVVKSRHVFKDRWISVRADDCVTAAGAPIAPYYVLEYPDWVHMVALDEENRILMTRLYRHGAQTISLELPCGCVDRTDASPEAAARREVLEETGCSGEFTAVGQFSPNPATHANMIHVFLVRKTRAIQPPTNDASEVVHSEFIPIRKLAHYLDAGEVKQSMHVCSLVAALRRAGLLAELALLC